MFFFFLLDKIGDFDTFFKVLVGGGHFASSCYQEGLWHASVGPRCVDGWAFAVNT